MIEVEIRGRDGQVRAVALLDDDQAALAEHRWQVDAQGYVQRIVKREGGGFTSLKMHRAVMGLVPGDGLEVDHRSHDKLDNRRSNLRVCTHAQNHQNRYRGRGASRFRGVTWNRGNRKWQAQVGIGGRTHYLGLFESEEEAGAVAAAFRAEHMPFSSEAAAC